MCNSNNINHNNNINSDSDIKSNRYSNEVKQRIGIKPQPSPMKYVWHNL